MNYILLNRTKLEALGATGPQAFGTADLIRHFLENDQAFNTNVAGIRAGERLSKAIEHAIEGKYNYVAAETTDYATLKQAVENPKPMPGQMPYPLNKTVRLLPYIDDILSASDKEPKEEKSN